MRLIYFKYRNKLIQFNKAGILDIHGMNNIIMIFVLLEKITNSVMNAI